MPCFVLEGPYRPGGPRGSSSRQRTGSNFINELYNLERLIEISYIAGEIQLSDSWFGGRITLRQRKKCLQ